MLSLIDLKLSRLDQQRFVFVRGDSSLSFSKGLLKAQM